MLKGLKKIFGSTAKPATLPESGKPEAAQKKLNLILAIAVTKDDVEGARQAIQNGAQVNADMGDHIGGTPLRRAVNKGHLAMVNILLEAGAAVDGKDYSLVFAAGYGHAAIVKALLEAGAAVDVEFHSITPLNVASCDGKTEAAKLLLAAGADLSIEDISEARSEGHTHLADDLQSIMDDPANRPTPESVGLDFAKRIAALEALGKPLGPFTLAEKKRMAQRETREAQRRAALRGEGI